MINQQAETRLSLLSVFICKIFFHRTFHIGKFFRSAATNSSGAMEWKKKTGKNAPATSLPANSFGAKASSTIQYAAPTYCIGWVNEMRWVNNLNYLMNFDNWCVKSRTPAKRKTTRIRRTFHGRSCAINNNINDDDDDDNVVVDGNTTARFRWCENTPEITCYRYTATGQWRSVINSWRTLFSRVWVYATAFTACCIQFIISHHSGWTIMQNTWHMTWQTVDWPRTRRISSIILTRNRREKKNSHKIEIPNSHHRNECL